MQGLWRLPMSTSGAYPEGSLAFQKTKKDVTPYALLCKQESNTFDVKRRPAISAQHRCVAGIAQPQDFERSAAERGITAHQKLFMADHCPFPEAELRELQRNCDAFLTTEKDFARAHALFLSLSIPTYVLPLKVQWSGAKPNF
jgi:tetraacyldisaccharide-1-P 4'-kinase